ncbi:MAG: AmmeMemoRadiSam system protein A [Waddliaceae bacterium]
MESLTGQEKIHLLRLVRETICRQVRKEDFQLQQNEHFELKQVSGAFIALHIEDELRGCLGEILIAEPLPLYRIIQELALDAAAKDPRFHPIQPQEVGKLNIEISVLSSLKPIQSYEEIEVGSHGLIVQDQGSLGLLLPQEATKNRWDREAFLSHACLKAGLPKDHWKGANPKVKTFFAEVFSELDYTQTNS